MNQSSSASRKTRNPGINGYAMSYNQQSNNSKMK